MKTITLEEIYADPHVLDPLVEAGQPVEVTNLGKSFSLIPTLKPGEKVVPKKIPKGNHLARMIEIYGPDVLESTRSVADVFERLRRGEIETR